MLSRGPSSRPWLVGVATLLAVLLTARLGFWQLDRARQKLDLQEQIASRTALAPVPLAALARDAVSAEGQFFRPITLRGRWLTERTVYLDNRQMNARQGFFVVTPLLLADGDAVLVQRGWSPRDFSDRTRLQPLATPGGEVLVTGRIAPPPSKLFTLGGAESGAIRQNIDLVGLAAETGVALRPLSVQQTGSALTADAAKPALPVDDGLLRQWSAPTVDVGKHHGYAFQWFALCALITGLFVWFQLLRPRVALSPDVRSL